MQKHRAALFVYAKSLFTLSADVEKNSRNHGYTNEDQGIHTAMNSPWIYTLPLLVPLGKEE